MAPTLPDVDRGSSDSSASPSPSAAAAAKQRQQQRRRAAPPDSEQRRGLLDDRADDETHDETAAGAARPAANVGGVQRALASADASASSSSSSSSSASRPQPQPSPPSAGVPFAALSGGDDDGPASAFTLAPLPSPRRRRSDLVDASHPLPASSPPAFLQMPSPSPSPPPGAAQSGPAGVGGASFGSPVSGGDDGVYSRKVIWRQRCRELLSLATWVYYASHALREARKRKCNYALGLFSCFLVVLVAGVCFTLIARAPVVFLQQAEDSSTQLDLELTPSEALGSPFINYTQLAENVRLSDDFQLHSCRSTFPVFVYPPRACPAGLDQMDPAWKYVATNNASLPGTGCNNVSASCMDAVCPGVRQWRRETVPLTTISTVREQRMGLGRLWPLPPLDEGEVAITSDLAAMWRLREGDVVNVRLAWGSDSMGGWSATSTYPTGTLLHAAVSKAVQHDAALNPTRALDSNTSAIADALLRYYSRIIYLPLRVRTVLPKTYMKFESNSLPLLVAEQEHFLPYLLKHVHPFLRAMVDVDTMAAIMRPQQRYYPGLEAALDAFERSSASGSASSPRALPMPLLSYLAATPPALGLSSMDSWATAVSFNIPSRISTYLNTNYDTIQSAVVSWSSRLLYFGGFTQLDARMPVLEELSKTKLFSLYLGLILSVILTILFLLSTLLIYSLLLMSIETRSFELGVHRMCGSTRFSIVRMLLVQALSFSIPAWVCGLVVAQIVCAIVVAQLEASVEVPLSRLLTERAVGVGSVMGLCIPLLASVLPIRAALGANLQDALDTRHSKTIGVKFSISRSEDAGMDGAWLATGAAAAIIGFAIYYLMPLALLSFDLALLINIFFALLLGMLLGLILLALNLQPLLERAIVFSTLFWERRALSGLVLKNLVAHRVRNRKTSIMFALSLGFVLFITAQFQLEIYSAKARTTKGYGGDLVVYPHYAGSSGLMHPVRVAELETLLQRHSPSAARSWGWVTSRLTWNGEFDDTWMSNVGHAFAAGTEVWGVSPSLFENTLNEYLVHHEDSPSASAASLSEQLHTVAGSQAAVLGSNAIKQYGLKNTDGARTSFLYALQKRASEDGTCINRRAVACCISGSALAVEECSRFCSNAVCVSVLISRSRITRVSSYASTDIPRHLASLRTGPLSDGARTADGGVDADVPAPVGRGLRAPARHPHVVVHHPPEGRRQQQGRRCPGRRPQGVGGHH